MTNKIQELSEAELLKKLSRLRTLTVIHVFALGLYWVSSIAMGIVVDHMYVWLFTIISFPILILNFKTMNEIKEEFEIRKNVI
ncbi:hypothetical protein [Sphingobacterium sp. 1.A.5]|jgi:hypothetical protein|uniref:hypothetical protein n=1 Tax=Sphingobacterium sp. 1.A.5 TaxID=2044604 RepID=UPI000C0BEC7D|nr:hypothetical protein [Sphingobacterium sp. 1.A.5]